MLRFRLFEHYMPHLTWLNVRIGSAGERQRLIFHSARTSPAGIRAFHENILSSFFVRYQSHSACSSITKMECGFLLND